MRFAVAAGLTILAAWAPAAAPGGGLTADPGGLRLELTSVPVRPTTGAATVYRARVVRADGRPATGLKLTLGGRMADGMTVLAPLRPAGEPGVYEGRVLYTMEGQWELTVRIADKGQSSELPLSEQVGR